MEDLSLESAVSKIVLHDSDEGLAQSVRKAYEYYVADNIQEALSLLLNNEDLLKHSYVQVLLGNCYRKNNNLDKAISCWNKAIELNPQEFSAYLNIGNIYYAQSDTTNAIANWTIAFSIQPENPVVSLNLAVAYNEKGYRIKATKFFERYLKYCSETLTKEYLSVKETILRLRGKVDFYFRKLRELKEEGNIRAVVTLYIKLISTYADLPSVYLNLANIFLFDKNNEKALDFFLIVYKNFEHSNQVIWNIAGLCEMLSHKPEAYCFFKRCEKFVPRTSSKYKILTSKLEKLLYAVKTEEVFNVHLQKARDYEATNLYEDALLEYENCLYLATNESPEIQNKIEKLKLYISPEEHVITDLYSQINDAMNSKKFNKCIELCDRIIMLSDLSSKEGKYAVRCKTECKRILMTKDRLGH